jgi:WD40 repeat protein
VARGKKVTLWDLTTGDCRNLIGHTGNVNRIVFSRDSTYVVTADYDGTLRAWHLTDESVVDVMRVHTQGIGDIAAATTGEILSTGFDGRLVLWRPFTTPTQARTIYKDSGALLQIETLVDSDTVAVSRENGAVLLVSRNGDVSPVEDSEGLAQCLLVASASESWMVFGSCDGKVTTYSVGDNRTTELTDIKSRLRGLSISATERFVAVSSADGPFVVIDLRTLSSVVSIDRLSTRFMMFSRNEPDVLVQTSPSGDVRFYSLDQRAWSSLRMHHGAVNVGVFSYNGQLTLTGDGAGVARLVDVRSMFQDSAGSALPTFQRCE